MAKSKPKKSQARPDDVYFVRTPLGQCVYDIYISSMSAEECARRHPGYSREWILKQRNSKTGIRLKKRARH